MKFFKCLGVLVVSAFVCGNVCAVLPTTTERDWIGYYLVSSQRKFSFAMNPQGECRLIATSKEGRPLIHDAIEMRFIIEEVAADGKIVRRKIIPESLESDQPAGMVIKDVVIKGKAQGDILFEIAMTEEKGAMLLGGKITSPGRVTNPLRVAISAWFPDLTPGGDSLRKKSDENSLKKMKKLLEEQELTVKWVNGKVEKPDLIEPIDASSEVVTGPGIQVLSGTFSVLANSKFEFTAAPNSSMVATNNPKNPLHKGFTVLWRSDLAKDPENKARLSVLFR